MSYIVYMEKCETCQDWPCSADCAACFWREQLEAAQSEDDFERVLSESPCDPYLEETPEPCEEWDDNALPF